MDAFYFAGIGEAGSVGVLVDRDIHGGKISVFTSLGNGEVESRYCKIRGNFTSEQLRKIFIQLESAKPKATSLDNKDDFRNVLESFMPDKKRLTSKSSGLKKARR